MVVLMKTIQVILALSVLILIHEFGHFTFARIFGIRVDKFFMFFDVNGVKLLSTKEGWFSRLFPKLKEKETEYGIGWLPLGGYCKICGMVDESMDTDFLKHEAQPYEFRSKKAWKRLLVMAGGVLFNFIFAIIAYIGILDIWGETYLSNSENQIYVNDLAYDMGFRNGDKILSLDDYVPENFSMLQADMARKSTKKVRVLRDGDTLDIYLDHSRLSEMLQSPGMFDVAVPFVVDSVPANSPNVNLGYERGDRIVAIDGKKVSFVQDSREVMKDFSDTCLAASVVRGADTLAMGINVDSTGHAMIYAQMPGIKSKEYNFLTAIPAGFRLASETIGGYLDDLKMVATPSTGAYKSVGSFIAIGQVFPSTWDWYRFLYLLALLSIMLGVMNLIPIPGLDGGHIVFTLYEMVTGRKPGDKFLMAAQMIGMALLVLLMVLAFGNDISRLFK